MVVAVPSVFMVSGEVRGTATTPEPDMYAVLGSMPHDQNSAGHLWTISTNPSFSYIARRIGLSESSYQNMRLCSSVIDPQCLPISNASLNGQVVLGHCLTDVEVGCIEGLKSINQQGVTEELIRSGHAGQQTLFHIPSGQAAIKLATCCPTRLSTHLRLKEILGSRFLML
jgi:hypothetical protein